MIHINNFGKSFPLKIHLSTCFEPTKRVTPLDDEPHWLVGSQHMTNDMISAKMSSQK